MSLEDRQLLSVFTVTNTHDNGSETGTLRWAVSQANAAGGDQTIAFDKTVFATPLTIVLTGAPLELSDTTGTETIIGPKAGVTVDGGGLSRVFQVDPNVTASISGLTISGGTARNGGGLYNSGTATLASCTISNSSATSLGGGLYNSGTATLTNCTVSGNSAVHGGGGLANSGMVTLIGCTVSGNSAAYYGTSGGLFNNGTATLTNTIVAGNEGFADVRGRAVSGTNNVIGGDPLLAPLGNYGGPTQTMPLLPGSPAIDAGTGGAGVPTTDQRGLGRVGAVDIGAFESRGFTLALVRGSTPQKARIGSPFALPLAVNVKANSPMEPVDGGVVGFDAGRVHDATAMLSAPSAVIAGGQAAVTAAPNNAVGQYTVRASATGSSPVSFALKNDGPRFNSLVVNTTSNALFPGTGLLSLPEAVAFANHDSAGISAITFDKFVFAAPQTITLAGSQLQLSNTSETETITGPKAGVTVSGGGLSRVFQVDPNVTASISGLTITKGFVPVDHPGFSGYGGGLYNQGALTLTGVTVSNNYASGVGGGIANSPSSNASITLKDCSITGNLARSTGGLANGTPGGVNSGTISLTGCTISGNTDYANCGGLFNGATATLKDCSISGNRSRSGNGGIYMLHGNSLTVTDCSIDGNSGGGILAKYGTLSLTDSSVEDNSGIGVVVWEDSTISGCTISGNSGVFGGGLVLGTTATVTGCTISGNTARSYAGGVLVSLYSAVTISGCTISGNTTLLAESISTGGGLEIESGAVATISGCTISGNSSPIGGGVEINGVATLTDCTISGNKAAAGGGVFNYGTASLVACTVSGNSAPQGGGIDNHSSPYYTSRTTLTDTIVAGNTTGSGGAASDIGGTDPGNVTGTYNLIGTGGSGGLKASDHNLLNVADPGLAPLGDYGGPTKTMALQPNSPARHAGTAVPGVTTDQRGFALDSPPDIGAFQSQAGPLVVDTAIDRLGSPLGDLSLRQAINLANVLTGGATITFDKSAFAKKSVIALTAGPLELSNTTGPVTILGPGLSRLAVSGSGMSRVFQVDNGSSANLSGLTITGGVTSGDGGGLLNLGTVTLFGDAIVGNSAVNGGGIANAGTAVILGSSIDGNVASGNGGGIFNTGTLSMNLSDLSANRAGTDGGGLYNRGTAALDFCTVDVNAASSGGGVYADASGGPVVLLGTEAKRNKGGNIAGRVIQL